MRGTEKELVPFITPQRAGWVESPLPANDESIVWAAVGWGFSIHLEAEVEAMIQDLVSFTRLNKKSVKMTPEEVAAYARQRVQELRDKYNSSKNSAG